MKTLAKQLREERERQGITQEELAIKCGMHRTQLVQIENGGLIHEGTAAKIAKALGFMVTISLDKTCPISASNSMADDAEKK
jgi:transcriptional regulator with XRE-family HTH domain